MRFKVLGTLEVDSDDGRIEVSGAKRRALLAYLIVHNGHVVSLDRIVEDLWGDAASAGAAATVQTYVSQLRKVLPPGAIRTVGRAYGLDVDPTATDVQDMEGLVRRAGELPAPERIAVLEAARDLWRGDPLHEFTDQAWASTAARVLTEQHQLVIERWVDAMLEVGRAAETVPVLEEVVAAYPLHEAFTARSMVALYRVGRQADALAVYQDARSRLIEELGLEPAPELADLERRILEQDPALLAADPPAPEVGAAGDGGRREEGDATVYDLGSARRRGVGDQGRAVVGLAVPEDLWPEAAPASAQISPGNLPRPRTGFVGDRVELQRQAGALADGRLVTLTGSGGVGKTRAAIEIGWLVLDQFPDGAWFVELAPISDPMQVGAAIATALGVQPQPGLSLVESIVDWCMGRRVLLVIDNCEHVLEPATEVVGAIVSGCPTATVLATSREPLGAAGERVVRIPPLDEVSRVELFRIRAQAAGATLSGSAGEADAISSICARLDGIPLAIEIASARTRSLTPIELLARLDDRFHLLRASGRGAAERHQTLRATVTWSYQLLSEQQQLLFDRLSVFAGDFDLAAVESVCSDEALEVRDMVDRLCELVDKSMVTAERVGDTTGFRLLETLRQYGDERLGDRGETGPMRDRHLAYFADLAREIWDQYVTPAQRQADATITAQWANLRAAHSWAIAEKRLSDAVAIVSAIHYHARNRMLNEVADWVEHTLALADELGVADVRALAFGSEWARVASEHERSRAFARRAWDLAADLDLDARSAAVVRSIYLRAVVLGSDEAAEAVDDAHRALDHIEDVGARWWILEALLDAHTDPDLIDSETRELLEVARRTGSPMAISEASRLDGNRLTFHLTPPDYAGAMERHREAAAWAASDGSVVIEGWARSNLAAAAILSGAPEAGELTHSTLEFANEIHHSQMIDNGLTMAAFYLASRSELARAALILGNLDNRESAIAMEAAGRAAARAGVADLEDLEGHLARGAVTSRAEIVAVALAALEEAGPGVSVQPIDLPR